MNTPLPALKQEVALYQSTGNTGTWVTQATGNMDTLRQQKTILPHFMFLQYHASKVNLKFTVYMRMTLNVWPSCLQLCHPRITGVQQHTLFVQFCGWNSKILRSRQARHWPSSSDTATTSISLESGASQTLQVRAPYGLATTLIWVLMNPWVKNSMEPTQTSGL